MTGMVNDTMRHLVAVYGTLKRGHSNSHVLARADFIGEDRLTSLTLYDLGSYPAARRRPSDGVLVEVYAVGDRLLREIDTIEGYNPDSRANSLYLRQKLQTRHGPAWIYLYNGAVRHHQRIDSGTW